MARLERACELRLTLTLTVTLTPTLTHLERACELRLGHGCTGAQVRGAARHLGVPQS